MKFPTTKTTATCELCGEPIRWDRNRWRTTEAADPVCPKRGGASGRRHIPRGEVRTA